MSVAQGCEVHEATAPRIETVLATVYTPNTPQISGKSHERGHWLQNDRCGQSLARQAPGQCRRSY
jgi:hypothetical protein